MNRKERFQSRYETGDTPWEIGRPDFNLVNIVESLPLRPCRAMDIGCGTGDNAIWLAKRGFDTTGIDLSELAIDKARSKAKDSGVLCRFAVADFLKDEIAGGPYGFIFDRGCFHSFDSAANRERFAFRVASLLEDGGFWISLIGNADEPTDKRIGPPRRTARDIVNAVEPFFEILSLTSGHFDSDRLVPPRAWICLMKKR